MCRHELGRKKMPQKNWKRPPGDTFWFRNKKKVTKGPSKAKVPSVGRSAVPGKEKIPLLSTPFKGKLLGVRLRTRKPRAARFFRSSEEVEKAISLPSPVLACGQPFEPDDASWPRKKHSIHPSCQVSWSSCDASAL